MRGTRKDVPRELGLCWDQRRYGVLPYAGGLVDQEPGLLRRMAILGDAYDAYYEYWHLEAGTGAEWQRRNPLMWAIVEDIEGLNGVSN